MMVNKSEGAPNNWWVLRLPQQYRYVSFLVEGTTNFQPFVLASQRFHSLSRYVSRMPLSQIFSVYRRKEGDMDRLSTFNYSTVQYSTFTVQYRYFQLFDLAKSLSVDRHFR